MKKLLTKAIDVSLNHVKSICERKIKVIREAGEIIDIRRRFMKGETDLLVDGKIDFKKYRERKLMDSKLKRNRRDRELVTNEK